MRAWTLCCCLSLISIQTFRRALIASVANSKHWFTSFLQPLPYLVTPYVPENCQLTNSSFVGAQTVNKFVTNNSDYIRRLFYVAMLLTPAQINPKSFNRHGTSFFTRGGCVSCLRACLAAMLLPQSYQYPNLSEGADRVGGQLRGDKECPFSGVTKSGRVWRKVPESEARSVRSSGAVSLHVARRWKLTTVRAQTLIWS